jgi:quinoprotein glucose dehydrogenase
MRRKTSNVLPLTALFIALGLIWISATASGQGAGYVPSTQKGDWPYYTADLKGTKYSPLDQVNASNFGKLEVAWRFKTDNLGPRPEYKLEGTPLAINGTLYTTGGTRRSIISLDGKTGEVNWAFSFREGNRAAIAARQLSGRGVSYSRATIAWCSSAPAIVCSN